MIKCQKHKDENVILKFNFKKSYQLFRDRILMILVIIF
jgi:hypothetical protein